MEVFESVMSAIMLATLIVVGIGVGVLALGIVLLVTLSLLQSAVEGIADNPTGAKVGCAFILVVLVLAGVLLLFNCVPD